MSKTPKRRVPCPNCGVKCKAGAGLSLHMRLKCRQNSAGGGGKEALQNLVPCDGNPPEVNEAIARFSVWMQGKLIFTGRTMNANKCARILNVWQSFVELHASFFVDNFGYKPVGKAGQRGAMFALFRDDILPAALRFGHVRSDVEGALSTMQDQARHVKRVPRCRAAATGWRLHARSRGGNSSAKPVGAWMC